MSKIAPVGSVKLDTVLSAELNQCVPEEVLQVTDTIRARHADVVNAVLFYGSCVRRKNISNAVLDFYVLISSYRPFYQENKNPLLLRWLNAALPPNVFYIEVSNGLEVIRAKYAVITTADFEFGTTDRALSPLIWARFSQPTRLTFCRDRGERERVVAALAQAASTFVSVLLPIAASVRRGGEVRNSELWGIGFRETYRTEFRPERPKSIGELFDTLPSRYENIATLVLRQLATEGLPVKEVGKGVWQLLIRPPARLRLRIFWIVQKFIAKSIYILRLLKTAITFKDWLPYVAWKLGRHAGVSIQLNERQVRHPFIWAWPILWRVLRQRLLR